MKIFILISLSLVISCSQTVETKKYQAFERVSYLEQGQRPEFYFSEFSSNTRAPASVEDGENISLRALYFSSIWQQKKQMESILNLSSNNYCPAFHQQVLDMRDVDTNKYYSFEQMYSKVKTNKNPLVYPVLALPYEGADVYTFSEENQMEVGDLKTAFTNYYQLTVKEVDSLCETGVSEGYYMTKNLTDYYVNNSSFQSSKKHLEAILKTPYVANLYVINSFKRNKNTHNSSLLYNLNASWFLGYLDTLGEARNNRVVKNTKLLTKE